MQFYLAHLGLAIFDLSNDILFASLGSCVLPVIMYIVPIHSFAESLTHYR